MLASYYKITSTNLSVVQSQLHVFALAILVMQNFPNRTLLTIIVSENAVLDLNPKL
jgi:hypothetical protein